MIFNYCKICLLLEYNLFKMKQRNMWQKLWWSAMQFESVSLMLPRIASLFLKLPQIASLNALLLAAVNTHVYLLQHEDAWYSRVTLLQAFVGRDNALFYSEPQQLAQCLIENKGSKNYWLNKETLCHTPSK